MTKPSPSSQWQRINETSLQDAASLSLETFKSGSANHKLAIWDPAKNGVRFLKELIFNLCEQLTPRQWELLRAVGNRHVGAPYAITYDGELVCLDYLQAVFEADFMERSFRFADAAVLEIGAGYGRTAHTLLANHAIAEYVIVDLDKALALAQRYLERVLPAAAFVRLRFVPVEAFESLASKSFDCCLNIDSFAEMDAEIVHLYLNYIRSHCAGFFSKNPVGKYLDKSLDGHHDGAEAVRLALKSGILRDVIDIYDNTAVRKQALKFVEAYAPGPEWRCVDQGGGRPWSFYWQAAYVREKA